MPHLLSKFSTTAAAAALALAALPQAAHAAGSSAGSGAAALTVEGECSLKGATVDLGTYTTNQTWGDVGAILGLADQASDTSYRVGALGTQYLELGTFYCPDTQFSGFNVVGSGVVTNTQGVVPIVMNGKLMNIVLFVKKVGQTTVEGFQIPFFAGAGVVMQPGIYAYSNSDGSPQKVLGSALVHTRGSTAALTDKLTAGTYTDKLTYTLLF
ncbi:MAG: hypothetical protein RLZZ427_924 [Pseudomonadota bacterium]